MAKFKNLKTGNVLTVKDEATIAMMRKNTERYKEVKAKKASATADDTGDKTE